MDILKHGILGLLLSCLLLACRQSKTRQFNVTHNETFSIIKQTNGNKPFCITLVDSTQALSQKFIERLKCGGWICPSIIQYCRHQSPPKQMVYKMARTSFPATNLCIHIRWTSCGPYSRCSKRKFSLCSKSPH